MIYKGRCQNVISCQMSIKCFRVYQFTMLTAKFVTTQRKKGIFRCFTIHSHLKSNISRNCHWLICSLSHCFATLLEQISCFATFVWTSRIVWNFVNRRQVCGLPLTIHTHIVQYNMWPSSPSQSPPSPCSVTFCPPEEFWGKSLSLQRVPLCFVFFNVFSSLPELPFSCYSGSDIVF